MSLLHCIALAGSTLGLGRGCNLTQMSFKVTKIPYYPVSSILSHAESDCGRQCKPWMLSITAAKASACCVTMSCLCVYFDITVGIHSAVMSHRIHGDM